MSLLSSKKKKRGITVHKLPFPLMKGTLWGAAIVAAHEELYNYVIQNVKDEDTVMGQDCRDCTEDGSDTAEGYEFLKSLDYAYKTKDAKPINHPTQAQKDEWESDYRNESKVKEGGAMGHLSREREPLERMSHSNRPVASFNREELQQALADVAKYDHPKYADMLPEWMPQWIEDVKRRATEEGIAIKPGGGLEVNEQEKGMSRHAYELYKNIKKGYSPQAAVTATPEHDEGEKRLHKMGVGPYSDKPRRGKKGLGESELVSRESLEEMIKKELMEMIKK
jgi:hypothetical protein